MKFNRAQIWKMPKKAFNEFNEIYGRSDNIKEHKKYLNVIWTASRQKRTLKSDKLRLTKRWKTFPIIHIISNRIMRAAAYEKYA